MKIFRATAAVALFAAISAASAYGQPRPTGPAPQSTSASVAVPDSKIALVDTGAFFDEKEGIGKLVNAMKRVDNEFQPTKTQLDGLKQQIDKATSDLNKAAAVQDPKITAQQQDKIDQMKKDLQRKAEDAQAAYQKKMRDATDPIQIEIGNALDAYAKARGITLVLDIAKMIDSNGGSMILSAAPTVDITKAFIADYNSKNPATASVTTPK